MQYYDVATNPTWRMDHCYEKRYIASEKWSDFDYIWHAEPDLGSTEIETGTLKFFNSRKRIDAI